MKAFTSRPQIVHHCARSVEWAAQSEGPGPPWSRGAFADLSLAVCELVVARRRAGRSRSDPAGGIREYPSQAVGLIAPRRL